MAEISKPFSRPNLQGKGEKRCEDVNIFCFVGWRTTRVGSSWLPEPIQNKCTAKISLFHIFLGVWKLWPTWNSNVIQERHWEKDRNYSHTYKHIIKPFVPHSPNTMKKRLVTIEYYDSLWWYNITYVRSHQSVQTIHISTLMHCFWHLFGQQHGARVQGAAAILTSLRWHHRWMWRPRLGGGLAGQLTAPMLRM